MPGNQKRMVPTYAKRLGTGGVGGWRPQTVAVVIPCHNYGRYLTAAIQSVLSQTRAADEILVVDDASTDDTAEVAAKFAGRGVRYLRVEHRHSQQTRRDGFLETTSDVLCFLDADDELPAEYLAEGLARMDSYRVGIVYSDLQRYGRVRTRTKFPEEFDRTLLLRENYLHSGSLVLREALLVTAALDYWSSDREVLQDWLIWRRITAAGWDAVKQPAAYLYRVHGASMIDRMNLEGVDYFARAGLAHETVTLFIPLSGRKKQWPKMARFLERQDWPHYKVRLVLCDTSHDGRFTDEVAHWIAGCDYADIRHFRMTVGGPGLADQPRQAVAEEVTLACARIYQRLARELTTDWAWIVEDDITPPDDACERLMRGFDANTASVSGVYRSRFANGWVCWQEGVRLLKGGKGVQPVAGNGFGCVVLRAEALQRSIFTATQEFQHAYEPAFYTRLQRETGMVAKVDWSVVCQHQGAEVRRRAVAKS